MRHGTWAVVLSALALLAIGVVVLGLDWQGHQDAGGVWRDGVSLERWGLLWGVVAIGGFFSPAWLPTHGTRLAAVTPLLLWLAFMLRGSALGPLAWVVYAVPTMMAVVGGGALGALVRRRWHGA